MHNLYISKTQKPTSQMFKLSFFFFFTFKTFLSQEKKIKLTGATALLKSKFSVGPVASEKKLSHCTVNTSFYASQSG